jgi:hypothetical protein
MWSRVTSYKKKLRDRGLDVSKAIVVYHNMKNKRDAQ